MKRDEPMACERCLTRRQFLARSMAAGAGAGAAALLAACGNGQIGPDAFVAPGGSGESSTIKVGDFPDLATAGVLVKVTSFQAVKRTGADTFAAYSMVCTHQGCLTELSSNAFFCPCHGSEFDASGAVTRGPAAKPLGQYMTSYDPATDLLTIGA